MAIPLQPTTVTEAVADSARYDVFGLVDRALEGDNAACLRMVRGIKAEGTDATIVLWALSRELRNLVLCATMLENGAPIDQVFQKQRIWDKRKPLVGAALKRLRKRHFEQLIKLANITDQSIKGMNNHQQWNLLEQLLMKLSGARVRLGV